MAASPIIMQQHLATLGVPADASVAQVVTAYRTKKQSLGALNLMPHDRTIRENGLLKAYQVLVAVRALEEVPAPDVIDLDSDSDMDIIYDAAQDLNRPEDETNLRAATDEESLRSVVRSILCTRLPLRRAVTSHQTSVLRLQLMSGRGLGGVTAIVRAIQAARGRHFTKGGREL